jgi:hypothetical protein
VRAPLPAGHSASPRPRRAPCGRGARRPSVGALGAISRRSPHLRALHHPTPRALRREARPPRRAGGRNVHCFHGPRRAGLPRGGCCAAAAACVHGALTHSRLYVHDPSHSPLQNREKTHPRRLEDAAGPERLVLLAVGLGGRELLLPARHLLARPTLSARPRCSFLHDPGRADAISLNTVRYSTVRFPAQSPCSRARNRPFHGRFAGDCLPTPQYRPSSISADQGALPVSTPPHWRPVYACAIYAQAGSFPTGMVSSER